MVRIPTTERQFYNTTPKVNTLAVTADALQPAAKQYAQTLMQQQKVKIDTNANKARVDIDNLQNQWQLANQANPDNPKARAKFQAGMQKILNQYGSEIDPIARMEWSVAANRIKSAYDIANNDWAKKQKAANAKLDAAENINLNLDLAYKHGLQGNVLGGWADLDNSYRQLYSYASANMGETEARTLLSDYRSDFTTSFVNGLIENNPQAALDFLNNEDNRKALKYERKVGALRNLAEKQLKAQKTQVRENFNLDKSLAFIKFLDEPTFDNLDFYATNYEPQMSDEKYKRLVEHVESLNNNAVTKNPEVFFAGIKANADMPTGTPQEKQAFLDSTVKYIDGLYSSNRSGKLRRQDVETLKKISVGMVKNEEMKQQLKSLPDGMEFGRILANVALPQPEIPQISDIVEIKDNKAVVKPRIASREELTRKVKETKKKEEETVAPMPVVYESEGEAKAALDELKELPTGTEDDKKEFLRLAQEIYGGIYVGSTSYDLGNVQDLYDELSETAADKLMGALDDLPQTGVWDTAKQSWRELSDTESIGSVDLNEDRSSFLYYLKDAFSPMIEQAGNIKRSIGVWGTAMKKRAMIEQIERETMHQMLGYMVNGDYQGAKNVYADGVKKAIRAQYPDVPDLQRDDLEPGKSLITINGLTYKFMGYTSDNILVEVQ
nr:MAG TPA: hypothetical protein [Caudoviricetes sp.]